MVATLRTEKRLNSIDKSVRDRAFRLLHAIAREAGARGHSASGSADNTDDHTGNMAALAALATPKPTYAGNVVALHR